MAFTEDISFTVLYWDPQEPNCVPRHQQWIPTDCQLFMRKFNRCEFLSELNKSNIMTQKLSHGILQYQLPQDGSDICSWKLQFTALASLHTDWMREDASSGIRVQKQESQSQNKEEVAYKWDENIFTQGVANIWTFQCCRLWWHSRWLYSKNDW